MVLIDAVEDSIVPTLHASESNIHIFYPRHEPIPLPLICVSHVTGDSTCLSFVWLFVLILLHGRTLSSCGVFFHRIPNTTVLCVRLRWDDHSCSEHSSCTVSPNIIPYHLIMLCKLVFRAISFVSEFYMALFNQTTSFF